MIKNIIKHRKSNRLPGYDYSQGGYYFVTICTKNKKEYFGEVNDGEMMLSEIGGMANRCWQEIPRHYSNVELDACVIMPNHVHGIIIVESYDMVVGNRHACSLQNKRQYQKIPIMIGSFKAAVTRLCSEGQYDFHWQKSFYDHVIRDEKSSEKIREYIQNNPSKWELDRNNFENLFM